MGVLEAEILGGSLSVDIQLKGHFIGLLYIYTKDLY